MATPFQIAISRVKLGHKTDDALYQEVFEIAASMKGTPMMSERYFEKAFGNNGYITPKKVRGMIINASRNTGAFRTSNLTAGRRAYLAAVKAEKTED